MENTQLKDEKTQLINVQEAADILGVNITTLATWRYRKKHALSYIKEGKFIKYRLSDIWALKNFKENHDL